MSRPSRQGTFANYRLLTRTKSNGIPVIRRPVGRIHVQNVLNESISSFLYVIGAKKRSKKAEMIQSDPTADVVCTYVHLTC